MTANDVTDELGLRDAVEAARAEAEREDPEGLRAVTLRLVSCAVRDRDVSARGRGECGGCPDEGLREILTTMAEQRRITAREFDEAGRIADAEREREELAVIEAFLPRPLSGDALKAAVQDVVEDLDAQALKDTGRCMKELKARHPGRIEPVRASRVVREALN